MKIKTIQHSFVSEAFPSDGGVKMLYMDKYPFKLTNLFNVTVVITIKVMNDLTFDNPTLATEWQFLPSIFWSVEFYQ